MIKDIKYLVWNSYHTTPIKNPTKDEYSKEILFCIGKHPCMLDNIYQQGWYNYIVGTIYFDGKISDNEGCSIDDILYWAEIPKPNGVIE